MYTRVIIEDLGSYTIEDKDYRTKLVGKQLIAEEHKLSEVKPRDMSVWTKSEMDKLMIKKCKKNYRKEMLSKHPLFTNRCMIVNTRAILWS